MEPVWFVLADLVREMSCEIACSVVVPVYNSQECLPELAAEIAQVFAGMGCSHELILVNDGSRDASWKVIAELARGDARVRGINLRKNFGQDNALMAGLRHARGGYVVIMDDDLQHDPHYIPELYEAIRGGHDVVYANYACKKVQKAWKNWGSWLNDKVAGLVLKKPHDIYLSPYKIITRGVVDEICRYDGAYPYVDGLIFRLTGNISQVFIQHQSSRRRGSGYTLLKSVQVWSSLMVNFSVLPLRVATVLGLFTSATGLLLAVIFIFNKFVDPSLPIGWTSVFVSVQIFAGVLLFAVGVMGEYVGRAYLNLNRHPQYSIGETTDGVKPAGAKEGHERGSE